MIGKVLRGSRVGGLLHYLFGPGRTNEHEAPHLAASWDGLPDHLEPPIKADGKRDLRRLTNLLEQPLLLRPRTPAKPVWHCALRAAPGDRSLTDAEWERVAREVMHRTGLSAKNDNGGCRWVAIRHADDHIHLVVTLGRQDGGRVSTSNDFYRLGEACRWAERHFGLTVTPGRDRTAARRPTRAENEKAKRTGRPETSRTHLRKEVQAVAAHATDGADFIAALKKSGLLVHERRSEIDPQQITGYAVALPGDRTTEGRPVWYGGSKLAADLSWVKLQRRWSGISPSSRTRGKDGSSALTGRARTEAWRRAARTAQAGARDIRQLARTDPAAAADAAHATADMLATTARVVEGRRGGALTRAANAYDRACRELHGRMPKITTTGTSFRATARLLALTGRASRDERTQVLALVSALTGLVESVEVLRNAQGRSAQAAAAREAAERLRSVSPSQPELPLDLVAATKATQSSARHTWHPTYAQKGAR